MFLNLISLIIYFVLHRYVHCRANIYICVLETNIFSYNGVRWNLSKIRVGRAVAQQLAAGFPPRRPGFAYGQHLGFVVDKEALGQVFSEYFGFPCQ
jgi:hypothetical protein